MTGGSADHHDRHAPGPRWWVTGIGVLLVAASVALLALRWPEPTGDASTGADGAGLAFRCAGPTDCWTVSVIPLFETASVFRTRSGTRHLVRNLGSIGTSGPVTLGVTLTGDRMTFLIDGEQRAVVTDGRMARQHGVGLSALPSTQLGHGRWTDLAIERADGTTETDSLRRARPVALDAITDPFSWAHVIGRWVVGDRGARLAGHTRAPMDVALVDEPVTEGSIRVTLRKIR